MLSTGLCRNLSLLRCVNTKPYALFGSGSAWKRACMLYECLGGVTAWSRGYGKRAQLQGPESCTDTDGGVSVLRQFK